VPLRGQSLLKLQNRVVVVSPQATANKANKRAVVRAKRFIAVRSSASHPRRDVTIA